MIESTFNITIWITLLVSTLLLIKGFYYSYKFDRDMRALDKKMDEFRKATLKNIEGPND